MTRMQITGMTSARMKEILQLSSYTVSEIAGGDFGLALVHAGYASPTWI